MWGKKNRGETRRGEDVKESTYLWRFGDRDYGRVVIEGRRDRGLVLSRGSIQGPVTMSTGDVLGDWERERVRTLGSIFGCKAEETRSWVCPLVPVPLPTEEGSTKLDL